MGNLASETKYVSTQREREKKIEIHEGKKSLFKRLNQIKIFASHFPEENSKGNIERK
jgi:hypothetical protein